MVPVPIVSGTGNHLQNRVGTVIDHSGIGTDASSSPNFCTLALLSLIFVHRLFMDPNKSLMVHIRVYERENVPYLAALTIFV